MGQKIDRDTWLFPGGKVEPDETIEAAARRELLEETGLTLGVLNPRGYFDGNPRWLVLFFDTHLSIGDLVAQGCDMNEMHVWEPAKHKCWEWLRAGEVRTGKYPLSLTEQHAVKLMRGM